MLTGKEYHCSVGIEVFRSIFNILGEGVAGMTRAWHVRGGCYIEDGGSGGQWEEEKKEEEDATFDSHYTDSYQHTPIPGITGN